MPAIHQLLSGYTHGDAISNHARLLRSVFRDWGHESDIHAAKAHINEKLLGDAKTLADLKVAPTDVAVLHLSIGDPSNHVFRDLDCRKAIIYHNVTPPKFYRAVRPAIAKILERGYEEVKMLAGVADVNMAVSAFNAGELEAMGYANVQVVPLLVDLSRLDGPGDSRTENLYTEGEKADLTTIAFVGRIAPNKCFEDLVHAFYYYQRYVNPKCQFVHAGSAGNTELYKRMLVATVRNLGIRDWNFLGPVSEAELRTVFRMADLFLCMSEHEGFCIPLLEAMQAQTPVLAYAAGAVPETLAGSGVLFHQKSWPDVAEMMGALTLNAPFRDAVIAAQNKRLALFSERDIAGELRHALAPLLS